MSFKNRKIFTRFRRKITKADFAEACEKFISSWQFSFPLFSKSQYDKLTANKIINDDNAQ